MSARGILRIIEGGLVAFWCPGCEEPHVVTISGSGAWGFNGNYEKPTFTPSVLVRGGHFSPDSVATKAGHCWCNFEARTGQKSPFRCSQCHSFVQDGQIQFLADSSHALAGKTVALQPFPVDPA